MDFDFCRSFPYQLKDGNQPRNTCCRLPTLSFEQEHNAYFVRRVPLDDRCGKLNMHSPFDYTYILMSIHLTNTRFEIKSNNVQYKPCKSIVQSHVNRSEAKTTLKLQQDKSQKLSRWLLGKALAAELSCGKLCPSDIPRTISFRGRWCDPFLCFRSRTDDIALIFDAPCYSPIVHYCRTIIIIWILLNYN